MSASRLSLALSEGGFVVPPEGRIAVFRPNRDVDLSAFPRDRLHVLQVMKPDYDHWQAQGYDCATSPDGTYDAAIVCLPRAKAEARALIADACAVVSANRSILIDGQKTDGVDSILKEVRKRTAVIGQIAKSHGKSFWFAPTADFSDWTARDRFEIDQGFVTAPGVFSADGIDPASQILVQALSPKLGGHVVDLGAGWGYLASAVLAQDKVKSVDLVEANSVALDCAKKNISDGRAQFHWADATTWGVANSVDVVVMNPPFHVGRSGDPGLGQAFIANAARLLKPSGQLWMVANRHLPYEQTLSQNFGQVTEIGGDSRFKVVLASRPTRKRA